MDGCKGMDGWMDVWMDGGRMVKTDEEMKKRRREEKRREYGNRNVES
jgi:hypothetical protein